MNIATLAPLLRLTRNENRVLKALIRDKTTVITIASHASLPRTTVYGVLAMLKKRGIAESFISDGKTYWRIVNNVKLRRSIAETRNALLQLTDGNEEVYAEGDSTIVVHRGTAAIKKLVFEIFREHKYEKLHEVIGSLSNAGWLSMFTIEEGVALNALIKKNEHITDGIMEEHWFQTTMQEVGSEWANVYAQGATIAHIIPLEFIKHAGQIYLFKDTLYLLALDERIIIEVRNSEIVKMIKGMVEYIKEESKSLNLRALAGKPNVPNAAR